MLSWRRLTGGGAPTLVACSGGADSSALALALASGGAGSCTIAHIVHDLRPRAEAEADRDSARDLAARLAWDFREAEIRIGPGNPESQARSQRYAALQSLAEERAIGFVATAHHADDQLETLVMALLRGTGPAGLRGAARSRPLGDRVRLIRPMLGCTRSEAEALCALAGHEWREDDTNRDTSRLRAALRHGPLAEIRALRPEGARRAARTARLMRDAHAMVGSIVERLDPGADEWPRDALRDQPELVLGELLREGARRRLDGARADRLTGALVDQAAHAIRSDSTDSKRFDWPGGLTLEVHARHVRFAR